MTNGRTRLALSISACLAAGVATAAPATAGQQAVGDRLLAPADVPSALGAISLNGTPKTGAAHADRPWRLDLCRWRSGQQDVWTSITANARVMTYPSKLELRGWAGPGAAQGDFVIVSEEAYRFPSASMARRAFDSLSAKVSECRASAPVELGTGTFANGRTPSGVAWVWSTYEYDGTPPERRQVMDAYALAGDAIIEVSVGGRVPAAASWGLPMSKGKVTALTTRLAGRWLGSAGSGQMG